jgi:hypothetical protein
MKDGRESCWNSTRQIIATEIYVMYQLKQSQTRRNAIRQQIIVKMKFVQIEIGAKRHWNSTR